jgi:hypothetical protein
VNDHCGVYSYVVIAENGVAMRSSKFGDDLGSAMGCVATGDKGDGSVGDEVTGKKDEIGCKAVDFVDDMFEEVGLGVFVEVDVTDLNDAVAMEGRWQVFDGDGAVDDVDLMSSDFASVESECCCGGAGTYDEISSA